MCMGMCKPWHMGVEVRGNFWESVLFPPQVLGIELMSYVADLTEPVCWPSNFM